MPKSIYADDWCYMCDVAEPPHNQVRLHNDGFHYHGKMRCGAWEWIPPNEMPRDGSVVLCTFSESGPFTESDLVKLLKKG